MATATTTGFTRAALEALPASPTDPSGASRERAFERFETLPVPSPETEEWRYTDLREVDLAGFTPFGSEPEARTLDDLKPDILEAAGDIGERSGLAVQHNSTVVS